MMDLGQKSRSKSNLFGGGGVGGGNAWTQRQQRPYSASSGLRGNGGRGGGGGSQGGGGGSVFRSLKDIAKLIKENEEARVVIMAGAGVSTASGIPDFRSPGTGLYDNLQQYDIPHPEAIFYLSFFHVNPKPFMALAKEIWPTAGNFHPNYVHFFIKLLEDKGRLLRLYSQNIDGLERLSGVSPQKLVEAHGTFSSATCIRCGARHLDDDLEMVKEIVLEGHLLPRCAKSAVVDGRLCGGIVKPDIVFFGEALPKRFFQVNDIEI